MEDPQPRVSCVAGGALPTVAGAEARRPGSGRCPARPTAAQSPGEGALLARGLGVLPGCSPASTSTTATAGSLFFFFPNGLCVVYIRDTEIVLFFMLPS